MTETSHISRDLASVKAWLLDSYGPVEALERIEEHLMTLEADHAAASGLETALEQALEREQSWEKVAREYEIALSDRGLL